MKNIIKIITTFLLFSLLLSSCASLRSDTDKYDNHVNSMIYDYKKFYKAKGGAINKENNAVVANPHYKIGSPYKIKGKSYYPKIDNKYDVTGEASWYGDDFAGKLTANGEIFDPNKLTAAHRTLPLPSVVLVKNLENGRSVILKVNDRGPYTKHDHKRIIDLSEKAAEVLGFKHQGIAKVRVKFLHKESEKLVASLKNNKQYYESLSNDIVIAKSQINGVDSVISDSADKYDVPVKNLNMASVVHANHGRLANSINNVNQTSNLSLANYKKINDNDGGFKGNIVANDGNSFFIHSGLFHLKDHAQTLVSKVSDHGRANIVPIFHQDKIMYKVRLGPIMNYGKAAEIIKKIGELKDSNAIIVKVKTLTN